MKTKLIILFIIVSASISIRAGTNNESSALLFFNNYIQLGETFDSTVAELYSDQAKVTMLRRYPHGLKRTMELNGIQWKMLIKISMPLGKAKGDISKYKNIEVQENGNKIKIEANRYSVLKCYTDTGYYMIIEKSKNDKYYIVEEYMETQPESNC
jgi:hypothetical protein